MSCRLSDTNKNACTDGQATDDSMGIDIVCWIPEATNTSSEYVILIAFALRQ